MALDELPALLERVRQARDARKPVAASDAGELAARLRLGGRQFLPGDRVFDTVSGKEATVTPTPLRADTNPSLVALQFDDRSITIRPADRLIFRPVKPSSEG